MFGSQLIVYNCYTPQTRKRQEKMRWSVRWLTIVFSRRYHIYTMRHQPSTTYLIYKIRVSLIITLTYALCKRYSIFNYCMTSIMQQNRIYGIVISALFHCMVLSSTFLLTLKISKSYYNIWQNISRIRVSTRTRLMISWISRIWMMWLGTSSLYYMN